MNTRSVTGGQTAVDRTPLHRGRAGWDGIASAFDEHVTPSNIHLGDDVLRRVVVEAGMDILDMAAGSGGLAIPAARRAGRVVATDISPAMLDLLDNRAVDEGLDEVQTCVMDGRALGHDDDSFDMAGSQHGVSLFDDVDGGLCELVRVTRPGGQVVVVTSGPPQHDEPTTFVLSALQTIVPGSSRQPSQPSPPSQLTDPVVLSERLTRAGLANVTVDTVARDLAVDSASHLWNHVASATPVAAARVGGLTDQQAADALWVLDGMLRQRSGGSPDAVLHSEVHIATGNA